MRLSTDQHPLHFVAEAKPDITTRPFERYCIAYLSIHAAMAPHSLQLTQSQPFIQYSTQSSRRRLPLQTPTAQAMSAVFFPLMSLLPRYHYHKPNQTAHSFISYHSSWEFDYSHKSCHPRLCCLLFWPLFDKEFRGCG